MPRDRTISATKPVFANYLLPSFSFSFQRRRSEASSSSSAPGSPTSTAPTTPGNSPPKHGGSDHLSTIASRLSRTSPDTICCKTCSTDQAFSSQIISKGFTGRYGRAFLMAAPPGEQLLLNIRIGRSEHRQLVTGMHVVADIMCSMCNTKLGWKYVDAAEAAQKYKVGKFILEKERVITKRHWDDVSSDTEELQATTPEKRSGKFDETPEEDEVEFDSDDEVECDDIFAGVWDPEVARRRRSRRKIQREPVDEVDYNSD